MMGFTFNITMFKGLDSTVLCLIFVPFDLATLNPSSQAACAFVSFLATSLSITQTFFRTFSVKIMSPLLIGATI